MEYYTYAIYDRRKLSNRGYIIIVVILYKQSVIKMYQD